MKRTENQQINYVKCAIITESGCDPKQGEYTLLITGFLGMLDISENMGGVDDISLIQECIINEFDLDTLPEEGTTEIILEETGEREDVFWHKYYKIIHVNVLT